ncbi:hypothetical protein [Dactylosporangium aurantiacum]|uniref:hypothetical protein n=1 Tax=Dactylosporangium aurantiacum TaxID=35754 RepID=UPI0012DE2FF3|nr:hypothetical protein [Dactylosporangium aurantiacum]
MLGVLLVLAGATLILLRALPVRTPAPAVADPAAADPAEAVTQVVPETVPVSTRIAGAWKSPTPADRLIFWGIVLLVLAAIAAGAITFNLGAAGGSAPATR